MDRMTEFFWVAMLDVLADAVIGLLSLAGLVDLGCEKLDSMCCQLLLSRR